MARCRWCVLTLLALHAFCGTVAAQSREATVSVRTPARELAPSKVWGESEQLGGIPKGYGLRWPSLATTHDTLVVAAVLSPIGSTPERVPRGIVMRYPGSILPLPSHAERFAFPRGVTDKNGTYHVIWGENPDTTYDDFPIRELWHSEWNNGRWSRSERIVDASTVRWAGDQGSVVVNSDNTIGVLVSVVRKLYHNTVFYVDGRTGQWRTQDLEHFATYVAIAAEGRRLVAALVGPDPVSRHSSVYAVSSSDHGRTWSAPSVIGWVTSPYARSVSMAVNPAGLHVVWAEPVRRATDSVVVRHFTSRLSRSTWSEQSSVRIAGSNILRMAVASDACTPLRVLVESISGRYGGTRFRLQELSWSRSTAAAMDLFPGASSAGVSAVHGTSSRLHLLATVIAGTPPREMTLLSSTTQTCGD
jgi:hypothetical protein